MENVFLMDGNSKLPTVDYCFVNLLFSCGSLDRESSFDCTFEHELRLFIIHHIDSLLDYFIGTDRGRIRAKLLPRIHIADSTF